MRRMLAFGAALLIALPGWAITKVSVSQLDSLLAEMHAQNKGDEATANKLKELELTQATQKAIMSRAIDYVTQDFSHFPRFTAGQQRLAIKIGKTLSAPAQAPGAKWHIPISA